MSLDLERIKHRWLLQSGKDLVGGDIAALIAEIEELRGLHIDGCKQTVTQLRAQRQAVLDLHREHGPTSNGIHCCLNDRQNWPCETVRALGATDE